MMPAGYMAKFVDSKPDWLKVETVKYIYSVSSCISADFTDYIHYWKHNSFWLFDSPTIIEEIAQKENLNLAQTSLFYYEIYEFEYHEDHHQWQTFAPESSFATKILIPQNIDLKGFDIVSFAYHASAECSPLSCNLLAQELPVNQYCLLDSLKTAQDYLQQGLLHNSEPGPYRIFAVYTFNQT